MLHTADGGLFGAPLMKGAVMPRHWVSVLMVVTAAAIVIALALVSYQILNETFGSGPPYYGRTTNMDKWTDPVPGLLAIDGIGLAGAGVLVWLALRRLVR